ncbi:Rab GTPase domain-containing protein, partial [Reticulomyxa filosa]
TLDERDNVGKTALETLPNVFNEMMEKGSPGQALSHLDDVIDGLFRVLDNPRYRNNKKEAQNALNEIIDSVLKSGKPEAVLFAVGVLTEQLDTEKNANPEARKEAMNQLKKILFGEGTFEWEDIDPDNPVALNANDRMLPSEGSPNREWLDIADGTKLAPSNDLYLPNNDNSAGPDNHANKLADQYGDNRGNSRDGDDARDKKHKDQHANDDDDANYDGNSQNGKKVMMSLSALDKAGIRMPVLMMIPLQKTTVFEFSFFFFFFFFANFLQCAKNIVQYIHHCSLPFFFFFFPPLLLSSFPLPPSKTCHCCQLLYACVMTDQKGGKNVPKQSHSAKGGNRKDGGNAEENMDHADLKNNNSNSNKNGENGSKGKDADNGNKSKDADNGNKGKDAGNKNNPEYNDETGNQNSKASGNPDNSKSNNPKKGNKGNNDGLNGESGSQNFDNGYRGSNFDNDKKEDSGLNPEDIAEGFRDAVKDGLGNGLNDPNKDNSENAAKLVHVMNAKTPGYSKDLDKEAQKKYFKWKSSQMKTPKKVEPTNKTLPKLQVGEKRVHTIDQTVKINIKAPPLPDI